jgi:predicted molibdopterin-dependent oxidoreductase YjgC
MLQGLEFLVVQDLFLTETAEVAHVVLPSAGFAEQEGTLTSTEGREQQLRPAVAPPGEARPGWAILAEVARRLGVRDVGSTLEDVRSGMTSQPAAPPPAEPVPDLAAMATTGHSSFQHVPDRLGWMWLRDTVLRHTDDWQREHQDRWIEIHPEDAKQLALRPGWVVRVTGDGGEFQARARVSDRATRGILVTPHDLLEGPVQLERAT